MPKMTVDRAGHRRRVRRTHITEAQLAEQIQAIEAILSTYGASRYSEGYRSSLKKAQRLLDEATTRIKKLGPL